MKYVLISLVLLLLSFIAYNKLKAHPIGFFALVSFYELDFIDIDGNTRTMEEFRGKNILIVNVASNCGFTSQYNGLQKLQKEYKDKLVVIGFPCNQFGGQEPGSEEQIKSFCEANYNVDFLLATKINVKGEKQHKVYKWLTSKDQNGHSDNSVKWNFQKYFIDSNGRLINYFYSITKPTSNKIKSLIK